MLDDGAPHSFVATLPGAVGNLIAYVLGWKSRRPSLAVPGGYRLLLDGVRQGHRRPVGPERLPRRAIEDDLNSSDFDDSDDDYTDSIDHEHGAFGAQTVLSRCALSESGNDRDPKGGIIDVFDSETDDDDDHDDDDDGDSSPSTAARRDRVGDGAQKRLVPPKTQDGVCRGRRVYTETQKGASRDKSHGDVVDVRGAAKGHTPSRLGRKEGEESEQRERPERQRQRGRDPVGRTALYRNLMHGRLSDADRLLSGASGDAAAALLADPLALSAVVAGDRIAAFLLVEKHAARAGIDLHAMLLDVAMCDPRAAAGLVMPTDTLVHLAASAGSAGILAAMMRMGIHPDLVWPTHLDAPRQTADPADDPDEDKNDDRNAFGVCARDSDLADRGSKDSGDDGGRSGRFVKGGRAVEQEGAATRHSSRPNGAPRGVRAVGSKRNATTVVGISATADGTLRGTTPLHSASRLGTTVCVALLLASGASTRSKTHQGSTPLHEAAAHGHTAVVRLLLAAGASTSAVRIADGITPAAVARRAGFSATAAAIEAYADVKHWGGAVGRGHL